MEKFVISIISNRALASGINGQLKTADRIENTRWNLLANCIERAIEHNDVTWVNRGREMARSFKSGMVNDYVRIAKDLVPFGFKFSDGWSGKIKANKRDKLRDTWQELLTNYVNELGERDPKAKNDKTFDEDKYLKQVIAKLAKNDVDAREFASKIVKAQDAVVQEVAKGQEEEAAEEVEELKAAA